MELQWFQSPDNQMFYFTLDGEDSAGADSGVFVEEQEGDRHFIQCSWLNL